MDPCDRGSGRRTRAAVITLEHAGDCPRNGILQRADGVAVTFIPDNDREETGGSGGRAEGRRTGDRDPDAVRDQFSGPRRGVLIGARLTTISA